MFSAHRCYPTPDISAQMSRSIIQLNGGLKSTLRAQPTTQGQAHAMLVVLPCKPRPLVQKQYIGSLVALSRPQYVYCVHSSGEHSEPHVRQYVLLSNKFTVLDEM